MHKPACIGGLTVTVLASNTVDRGFEHRSSLTKDYNIGICYVTTVHEALNSKSKY